MAEYIRKNPSFSLCGLNCALCSMHPKHCPGCGAKGHQSCRFKKCAQQHGNIEYCYQCAEYPCPKYEHFDDFDSIVTHQHRKHDFEKTQKIGISAYLLELNEKKELLSYLICHFNDGRKKTLFHVAVNLLEVQDIKRVITQVNEICATDDAAQKERASMAANLLHEIATERNVTLKLNKKK